MFTHTVNPTVVAGAGHSPANPTKPIAPSLQPKFLRVRDIVRPHGILPIARSTWFHWVQTGRAPAGIKLTAGVTVWPLDVVMALASGEGQ